jgi:molybdate transport system substrate-binding protein
MHNSLRLIFTLCTCALGCAQAGEVSVAVAANFAAPMQQIALAFEQETGHKASLSVGSTGRFYAQIKNGAPYQVLLAADDVTPGKLESEGLAVAGSRLTYAVGKLVLWSPQPNGVDSQGEVLKTGQFEKLALADPRLAPYGAAAIQTLTRLGLLDNLRPKIVQGENIAQTYQFVATGNAALGFVALSQVFADGRLTRGSVWRVPDNFYTPIRQVAILLRTGQNSEAASALMQFLRGAKARAIIQAYGYEF